MLAQIFADRVEKLRNAAPMVLKTLADCPAFYNAPNEIKGSNLTTNLGVRRSNLFGRATSEYAITAERWRFCVWADDRTAHPASRSG
jgi:hypothetical protein